MRLIDADALVAGLEVDPVECPGCPQPEWLHEFLALIENAPTIKISRNAKTVALSGNEAYSVAEFIDLNLLDVIRTDTDWDSFRALRNLVHAYEKCSKASGYVGMTDPEGSENGSD